MNNTSKASLLVAGGMVIGGSISYVLTVRSLEAKYLKLVEEEIASVKRHYAKRNKTDEFSTPESAAEILLPLDERVERGEKFAAGLAALTEYQGTDDNEDAYDAPSDLDLQDRNVFENPEALPWDYDLPERTEEEPYIISVAEFMNSEFDQITITYYESDNTLCDERDVMIPDIEGLVGQSHLGMFGRGSADENILYVRNEAIKTDFEIVRESGAFSVMVLGMAEAIVDEPWSRNRKPKRDDRDD